MIITENGRRKTEALMRKETYLYTHNVSCFDIGYGDVSKADSTIDELLHDDKRIDFMDRHLDALSTAIK